MDQEKHISTAGIIQPQKYNIVLTRGEQKIDFDFPPATAEEIARFGYIIPIDSRCTSGLVVEEEDLLTHMRPVLGTTFSGGLAYHTRKQVLITLHETAVLGYQRQVIIDPRLSNEIATFWEIYLDQRVFSQAHESSWQQLMAEVISAERTDQDADRKLAEDIKNILLQDAEGTEENI